MHIFISHSSRDAEFADSVCRLLEGSGHNCFIAPRDIRPGREYAEEIIDGITGADIMLLLLSEESNRSQHVFREVERAVSSHVPIVVYKMEEVELTKSLSYFLMVNQWIDGTKDRDLDRILEVINGQAAGRGRIQKKEQNTSEDRSRKKKTILFFAFFIGCVLLMSASFAIWQGMHRKNEADRKEEQSAEEFVPGDKVTLGTYEGEPIEWLVLHLSEDKLQAILISEKIITMKCFDAAESGTYNSYKGTDYWKTTPKPSVAAFARGSNLWADANIRTWLNSEKHVVLYGDKAPDSGAMSEKKNGYSTEPGFLCNFSKEERAVLREKSIFTVGNILTDSYGINTEDRVFLLSEEELVWFGEADISIYAVPTEAAVTQDKTKWYEAYSLSFGLEEYIWLLRDPWEDSASACKAVSNGYGGEKLISVEAGAEGFGIRPAICVDCRALSELLGSENR